jgi:hypothetical protein
MILDKLIDKVGDSNPQIFRELKERLTLRNIGIAIAAALMIQGFVLIYFNGQIPIPAYGDNYESGSGIPVQKLIEAHSKYCNFSGNHYNYGSELCKLDGANNFNINWQFWWSDVFFCLSWILSFGLILGSVYTLVADLVQEEKRGTLNFIRLSPQSAQKIFIGKILGVPILVYLAIGLIVPLHLCVGLSVGGGIPLLASWYAAIGSIWFLVSSVAVLYVLLGGIQAIVTTIVVGWPLFLPIQAINLYALGEIRHESWMKSTDISWFGLPIASSAIGFYIFGIIGCSIISFGVWQAIERRYLNPMATAVGKSQSYLANLFLQIGLAGFGCAALFQDGSSNREGMIAFFTVIDFMALFLLIPMLLPSKQSIKDWSRHRRERTTNRHGKIWRSELFKDLIHNDNSPALLTIAINIGMAMILWIPIAMIGFNGSDSKARFFASICLGASLILIYAAIAHLCLFLNVKKRNLWIVAIITVAMVLPIGGAFILSPFGTPKGLAAIMLLFSPFAPVGMFQLSGGTILATFAAQLGIFGVLTRLLQRRLQISGQSQTKELLARG